MKRARISYTEGLEEKDSAQSVYRGMGSTSDVDEAKDETFVIDAERDANWDVFGERNMMSATDQVDEEDDSMLDAIFMLRDLCAVESWKAQQAAEEKRALAKEQLLVRNHSKVENWLDQDLRSSSGVFD